MGIARVVRVDSPYHQDELTGVQSEQTATEMYTVSLDKPVQKLSRASHTEWAWAPVVFGPTITAPAGLAGTPNYGDGGAPADPGHNPTNYLYVVTGVNDGQESRPSASITVVNDLSLDGNYNQLTWTAGTYDRYIVYKENNGVYGYLGGTEGVTFRDQNITANLTTTPPKASNPFAAGGDYPSAIAFHEQRLFFGRTRNLPNGVWATQNRFVENMDAGDPPRGDDALSFALRGKNVNAVNQLISSTSLLALTSDSLFSITGAGERSAIGPDGNIIPKKQTQRNASRLRGIEVDNVIFYEPRTERGVRALGYTYEVDGYKSNDISLFSNHLFADDVIIAWAYQAAPGSIIWAVMASGALLAFVWQQEHEVWGWTRCDTDGAFEDVVAVPEGGTDRVYCIVRRVIDGVTRRFVERLTLPSFTDLTLACPVDCAVTYTFEEPQTELTGLWHLEGATVSVFADGFSIAGLVVEDGKVTLNTPASVAAVGLPFECVLRGLPPPLMTQTGAATANRQTAADITLKTRHSRGLEVGLGESDDLMEQVEPYEGDFIGTGGNAGGEVSQYQIPVPSTWSAGTQYVVRQSNAHPAQLLGLFVTPVVAAR